MLSRILQSINTNVRELSGRQPSPLSPISAKVVGVEEKDYDSGVLSVQGSAQQQNLAEAEDDKSRQPLFCRGDVPIRTQIPDATDTVQLEKKMELYLKTKPINGITLRSSTKLSRTVRLAEFKLPIRSVEVRQINVKRQMRKQQALAARKKPRKDLETQVTDNVTSFGYEQTKSSKSRKRWCRRCGTVETCRWRTSPAGSQTACNACYLMVKGKRLPDTEFENVPIYPLESLAISAQSGKHIKKPGKVDTQNAKFSGKDANTATNDDKKKMIVEATAMQCANIQCRTKATLVWRRGPDGVKCLCNRCGLRWANGRLPRDQIVPVNFIPDKASAQLKLKEPSDNLSVSRAERWNSQTQKKSNLPDKTIVLENDRQGPSERKKFLDAGLYSNEHKAQSIGRSSKATNSTKDFVFKLPEYHGEYLLAREGDFRLSYDIMDAFRRKQIGKEAEEYKQKSLKPNPYVKIRSNVFVERKHTRHNKKSPVCQCKLPADGFLGCNEDCLNRMMFYECDVQTCPCGKLCSNQRFQHKEEVNDLMVFWTNGRGWGLQTLTDIKAGQLITEYRGEIISQRLCEERLRTVYKDTNNFYFLDYQNGEVIDAAAKGSDARFVNHSCDPNCHIEKWAIGGEVCVGVFASQDISAGSELFYDYNYTLIGSGVSQKCRCESTKCRGYMGRKASVRDHLSK